MGRNDREACGHGCAFGRMIQLGVPVAARRLAVSRPTIRLAGATRNRLPKIRPTRIAVAAAVAPTHEKVNTVADSTRTITPTSTMDALVIAVVSRPWTRSARWKEIQNATQS